MEENHVKWWHGRVRHVLSVVLLCTAGAMAVFIAQGPPRLRYVPHTHTIPCWTLFGAAVGAWFGHPILGGCLGFVGGIAVIFCIVFGMNI